MKENAEARDVCFESIYKLIHDERMQCSNLAEMIDIEFPDGDIDPVNVIMQRSIKPYFLQRA